MSSPAPPDRSTLSAALSAAYVEACLGELAALKPGNVHVHAEGHGMSVADFERSARVSAAPLTAPGSPVGQRILDAVRATRAAVGCNTNLGIVLLAAPLLAAAEDALPGGLRQAVAGVLAQLTVADAVAAYEAIRIASPAGLGQVAEQDAAAVPTVDLRRAMALAAERDLIAREYATDFAAVFDLGVARLAVEHARGTAPEWATSHVYMDFLGAFADTHIARKYGNDAAAMVRAEASAVTASLAHATLDGRRETLLAFDQSLKRRGFNPGSAADLTVASLLACACQNILAVDKNEKI